MKKYLIPFVLTLCIACAEKPVEPIPSDVLSIEKMTAIMVDIQLIEGGIVIRKYNQTQRKEQITDFYRSLFNKHEVKKDVFDRSMAYYTYHPERLEEVYDGMMEQLSELEAEIQNEKGDSTEVVKESNPKDSKPKVRDFLGGKKGKGK